MKLNVKIYQTLNNPVEIQQLDGKEVEIHYMNDTPYLSRFAGRGNFAIWTSDGQGFKLLVERDYYNNLKDLHSPKINTLWINFYESVHTLRRNLFLKMMLPMLAVVFVAMFLFATIGVLQPYQTPVLIAALVLMLVFNMFQSSLLRRKVDEYRTNTIDGIKNILGAEKFEELVKNQNKFYENYFKFEEPVEQVQEIEEVKEEVVEELEETKEENVTEE